MSGIPEPEVISNFFHAVSFKCSPTLSLENNPLLYMITGSKAGDFLYCII
jgi:hypothetical protein